MILRAALCLCIALVAPRQSIGAQTVLPPSVDSALIRYVGKLAVQRVAADIASAAQSGKKRWWQISFPKGADSPMWHRLQQHLLMTVRGRDSVAGDTSKGILSVSRVRLNASADTLWFDIDVGGAFLCRGEWMGNTRGATYIAYRVQTTWMNDVKETDVIWSESFGCRE